MFSFSFSNKNATIECLKTGIKLQMQKKSECYFKKDSNLSRLIFRGGKLPLTISSLLNYSLVHTIYGILYRGVKIVIALFVLFNAIEAKKKQKKGKTEKGKSKEKEKETKKKKQKKKKQKKQK